MIDHFLPCIDRRLAVNHWLNWTGKHAYLIRRVHLIELSPEFEAAFRKSARRRRLPTDFVNEVLARVEELRASGLGRAMVPAQP
jgi:hypothetical protein